MTGNSNPPPVPIAQPDAASVQAANDANAADLQKTQSDLASQTGQLQRTYGAAGSGALNGLASIALTPMGAVAGVR